MVDRRVERVVNHVNIILEQPEGSYEAEETGCEGEDQDAAVSTPNESKSTGETKVCRCARFSPDHVQSPPQNLVAYDALRAGSELRRSAKC